MSENHEKFMAMAIEESRKGLSGGEAPFGSVIVRDDEVIGSAYNIVNSSFDPTAHAETKVVRETSVRLKTPNLEGSTLYTSCEPCPMCCGAILNARIGTLVIAGRGSTLVKLRGQTGERTYNPDRLAEMYKMDLQVIWGVLQEEAELVLAKYQWILDSKIRQT